MHSFYRSALWLWIPMALYDFMVWHYTTGCRIFSIFICTFVVVHQFGSVRKLLFLHCCSIQLNFEERCTTREYSPSIEWHNREFIVISSFDFSSYWILHFSYAGIWGYKSDSNNKKGKWHRTTTNDIRWHRIPINRKTHRTQPIKVEMRHSMKSNPPQPNQVREYQI